MKNFLKNILVLIFLFCISPSLAQAVESGGFLVYPANPDLKNPLTKSWFIYNLNPGETKQDALIIKNKSDEEKIFKIYPVDATTNNIGGFALEKESDTRDAIGGWVELETDRAIVSPGKSKKINFTISIPEDASVGEHAGGIIIQKELSEEQKNLKGGFIINTRLGVRIYQTVPGEIIQYVYFSNVNFQYNAELEKYELEVNVRNNGNVTMNPLIRVDIHDLMFKKQSQTISNNLLIPRESETRTKFEIKKPRAGKFSINISLDYETDEGEKTKNYGEALYFWAIPWDEISLIVVIILANIIFFCFMKFLKIRESKYYAKYKVKKGEDLEVIAAKFNMKWKKLAQINKIEAPFKLRANQNIIVINKNKDKEEVEEVNEKSKKIIKEEEEILEKNKKEEIESRNLKFLKNLKFKINEKTLFLILIIVLLAIILFLIFKLYIIIDNQRDISKTNKIIIKELIEEKITPPTPKASEDKFNNKISATTSSNIQKVLDQISLDEEKEVEEKLKKEDISIKILNGNGVKGASHNAYLKLKERDYRNIETGNADHFNYMGTTIKCGQKIEMDECLQVKEILSSDYTQILIEQTNAEGEENSITIILGT